MAEDSVVPIQSSRYRTSRFPGFNNPRVAASAGLAPPPQAVAQEQERIRGDDGGTEESQEGKGEYGRDTSPVDTDFGTFAEHVGMGLGMATNPMGVLGAVIGEMVTGVPAREMNVMSLARRGLRGIGFGPTPSATSVDAPEGMGSLGEGFGSGVGAGFSGDHSGFGSADFGGPVGDVGVDNSATGGVADAGFGDVGGFGGMSGGHGTDSFGDVGDADTGGFGGGMSGGHGTDSFGDVGDADTGGDGGAGGGGGGCFITTAAVEMMGWRDDGPTLTLFRRFRDTIMRETPSGRADIAWYERHAPRIVTAIDRRPERRTIYALVWLLYLRPAAAALVAGKNRRAWRIYREMVRWLDDLTRGERR